MGVTVSSSHAVSATPSSSGGELLTLCPAPAWGASHGRQFSIKFPSVSPSHGLQLFTNCPSVGPFHRVQFFRNRLLQCGSPTGSQALPANLFQHGLPTGSQLPSGIHLLRHGVPSTGYRWISAPLWTSRDFRGQPASPWSSSQVARDGFLIQQFGHLLPPLLHWPWCLQSGFSHIVSLHSLHCRFSCRVFFFPFLTMLSQRHYHHCWLAWPWPAARPS